MTALSQGRRGVSPALCVYWILGSMLYAGSGDGAIGEPAGQARWEHRAPPAVDALNVSLYVGRWYQVFGSASVLWTMEVGGHCVTADYAVSKSRSDVVTVQNAVRIFNIPVEVKGYGILNPNHAGELDVSLGPPGHGPDPSSAGKFERTNYLVFGLGPIVDGSYDYSLISDPTGITLYVLCRNVSRFHNVHETHVLATLESFNFTSFLNRPRRTNQTNCKYVPPTW